MPDYTLVNQPDSIKDELQRQDPVGVDTEFMRETTFFADLCLVQVATPGQIYCIDPLVSSDLDVFWRDLMAKTWVVHSARQDIEVIYQSARMMPTALFDTQIAAGLLGLAPQIGYAGLVKELFGIEISKSHTRADWSRRPLSDEYLHYAAEDVEYLLPAYDILIARLQEKGRLDWAREDSAQLLSPALYVVDPQLAIDRMKGAKNLRGKRRAAAARLAAWRESEALRANRPRQWIAKDSQLLEIANQLPTSVDELARIDALPAGLVRRSGTTIVAAVTAGRSDDNGYAPPRPPDEAQKKVFRSMQQYVATCAADLGIAAETLASKRDLSAVIINGDRDSKILTGWRRPLIGDRLLELM